MMIRSAFTALLYKALIKIIFLCSIVLVAGVSGCGKEEPIKIGFSGGLTGRHADLGLYGRNGVLLAFEEINSKGGVNGRPLELIVKDDEQDSVIALKVDKELIDEGVPVIIGHYTSTMTMAALPLINREDVLLFSPTASTMKLSGKDDNVIRTMPVNKIVSSALEQYIFDRDNIQKLAVVYDEKNRVYGEDWANFLKEKAEEKGRDVVVRTFVSAGDDLKFSLLASEVLAHNPDGIMILAVSLDAAMFCQQIRKIDPDNVSIYTSMWSMSHDFIQHGGKAVEGVTFPNWFAVNDPGEESQRFRAAYVSRFGQQPTFASAFSYEIAIILADALRETEIPSKLKEIILNKKEYEGIQGKIRLDKYGDAERDFFIMKLKDGKFITLEKM